jgi:hypothetical protein
VRPLAVVADEKSLAVFELSVEVHDRLAAAYDSVTRLQNEPAIHKTMVADPGA